MSINLNLFCMIAKKKSLLCVESYTRMLLALYFYNDLVLLSYFGRNSAQETRTEKKEYLYISTECTRYRPRGELCELMDSL